MSSPGRKLDSEFGYKPQSQNPKAGVRSPLTNEMPVEATAAQKVKSSSVSNVNNMSNVKEDNVIDQDDILELTQDVKLFSDGLAHLKTVFSEPQGTSEDLRVLCHSKLGEVLATLKNILHCYPALQSTEVFAASGTLISKIKSYNYSGPKDLEAEHDLFESIDQLALAFSRSVSDYLMGDLESSYLEKEEEKAKSYDNLQSPPTVKSNSEKTVTQEKGNLSPKEIDGILCRLQAGVDLALQRAKAWSKYMKDIASYIERKTQLESEYSKSILRLAQSVRPVLTEEGFLPLQSVYCTVLSQDIEYANTCQSTQVVLQAQKFVEPLTARRIEHDKARKVIKESWLKECKKMQDAIHSLRKAQTMYNTRQQEYEKAREIANKTESDLLAQSSSGAVSSKVDKRKKIEEDALHKAAEAETTYKACVAEANSKQKELEGVKCELLARVREQILQCDQVIQSVTVDYFQLLQTVTAPIPVQYHTLCETSKQYVAGIQYGEFVRRLSLTTGNLQASADPFIFEPYISAAAHSREAENRKTSTQSTGSSSELHSQDESPVLTYKKERYRVKAWSQGLGTCSDTDSASGSSKSLESSPSNSPHPSTRRSLVKSGSLDNLEETDGEVNSNLLGLPGTDGVDLHGILQRHGKRRNTTFGVDFQEQVQYCKSAVPPIIMKCLKEVEKRGMSIKGIYRVSGVKSKVEGLCSKFEKNPELVDLSDEHPNVISNVLKLYLRQLPEPLFTFNLYSSFIQIAKENLAGGTNLEETVQRLGDLVSKLPYSNFKTSAILMHHLHRVASFNHINQMTASNLGIVFGPTLLRPLEGTSSLASLVDTPHQTRTVELIISNVHEILGPDNENELIPGETPIEQLDTDAKTKLQSTTLPGVLKDNSVKSPPKPNTSGQSPKEQVLSSGGLTSLSLPKTSQADFCLPGSAHTDKKDAYHHSPSVSEGEDNEDVDLHSDEDLPANLLPDLSSQHALANMESSLKHMETSEHALQNSDEKSQHLSPDMHELTSQLSTDPAKGNHPVKDYQWYNRPIKEEIQKVTYPQVTTCKALPPHQLYLGTQASSTPDCKMLIPKITIIESSPVVESKPQMCYPLKAMDKHKTQSNKALQNLKSIGPSLQNFVINTAKGLVGKASFPSKVEKSHEGKEKKVKSSPPMLRHIPGDQLSFTALKHALQRSPKLPRQSSINEEVEISNQELEQIVDPKTSTVTTTISSHIPSSPQTTTTVYYTPPLSTKFSQSAFSKLSESYPGRGVSQSPQQVRKMPTTFPSPSILRSTSSYPSVAERMPYVPKFSPPVSRQSRVSFTLPEDSLSESESPLDSSHTSTMSSFSLGSPWSSPTIPRPTLRRQTPVTVSPTKTASFSLVTPASISKDSVDSSQQTEKNTSPESNKESRSKEMQNQNQSNSLSYSNSHSLLSKARSDSSSDDIKTGSEHDTCIDSCANINKTTLHRSTVCDPSISRFSPVPSTSEHNNKDMSSDTIAHCTKRTVSASSVSCPTSFSGISVINSSIGSNSVVDRSIDASYNNVVQSSAVKDPSLISVVDKTASQTSDNQVNNINSSVTVCSTTCPGNSNRYPLITSSSLLLSSLSPVLPRNASLTNVPLPSAPLILSGNLPFKSSKPASLVLDSDTESNEIGEKDEIGNPQKRNEENESKEPVVSHKTQGIVPIQSSKQGHVGLSITENLDSVIENKYPTLSSENSTEEQKSEKEILVTKKNISDDNVIHWSTENVLHSSPQPKSQNISELSSIKDNNSAQSKTEPNGIQIGVPYSLDVITKTVEVPTCVTLAITPSPCISPNVVQTSFTNETDKASVDISLTCSMHLGQHLAENEMVVASTLGDKFPDKTKVTTSSQRSRMTTRAAPQTSKSGVQIDPARAAKGPSGIVMGRSAIKPNRAGQRGNASGKKMQVQAKSAVVSSAVTKSPASKPVGAVTQCSAVKKVTQSSENVTVVRKKTSTTSASRVLPSVPCATCGRRKSAGKLALEKSLASDVVSRPRRGSADDLLRGPAEEQKGQHVVDKGEGGKKFHEQCQGFKSNSTKPLPTQRRDRTPRFV